MEKGRLKQLGAFFLEGAFGLFLVLAPIQWLDRLGAFDIMDEDHIRDRWWSLNFLQDKLAVDVLILGNSHAYMGVHPEWLSAATGMTCFVAANNGTNAVDNYWTLREALNYVDPQLVLLETTGLNRREKITDSKQGLVHQLRAFHARSDWRLKAASMLELFEVDDIPLALSKTVMNHHLWWTEPADLRSNILNGGQYTPKFDELYLGNFSRFMDGLEDSTVTQYRELGGVLQGGEEYVCEENVRSAQRIVELGKQEGFKVGFLTLPMHADFLANPEGREAHLREVIEPLGVPWLNLQARDDLTVVSEYFENTLSENQHLTYKGSLAVNQPIADWIGEAFSPLERPGRTPNVIWHAAMQMQEGYYAYHNVYLENKFVSHVATDVPIGNRALPYVVMFRPENGMPDKLGCYTRLPQSWFRSKDLSDFGIQLTVKFQTKEGVKQGKLKLKWDPLVNDGRYWLFSSAMPALDVVEVVGAELMRGASGE